MFNSLISTNCFDDL